MLEANVRFCKCKRCGKYFIMKGNYDTNYCNRDAEGETRNCRELAAQKTTRQKSLVIKRYQFITNATNATPPE